MSNFIGSYCNSELSTGLLEVPTHEQWVSVKNDPGSKQ